MSNKTDKVANFSICDLTSGHQEEFYKYWCKVRGMRSLPAREDIQPADIIQMLPFITLLEKCSEDYKVRLMGTRTTPIFGEKTGKLLSEIGYEVFTIKQLRSCTEDGRPYFISEQLKRSGDRHYNWSALAMPLSKNNRDVNMIVLVHDFMAGQSLFH